MNTRDKYQLKLRYKITISLISIILFYSFFELSLRLYVKMNPDKIRLLYEKIYINPSLLLDIFKHDYLEPDPTLYWKLKSKGGPFAVNSLGIRGKNFSVKKQPGVFRIFCLGDSSTYGACVDKYNKIYASILEKILNSNSNALIKYEVITAGVPGYSSFQVLMNLEKRIKYWSPDLVTIYVGNNNDYEINRYYDLEPIINCPIMSKIGGFFDRSYVFQLLKSYILKVKLSLAVFIDKDFFVKYRGSAFKLFEKHLIQMSRIAKENHFKILFLSYPYVEKDGGTLGELTETNQSIRNASRETKVPLVDIVSVLRSRGGEIYFLDRVHPNPAGHQIIAETIFNTMVKESIIPRDQMAMH